jgi:hypothetical protein
LVAITILPLDYVSATTQCIAANECIVFPQIHVKKKMQEVDYFEPSHETFLDAKTPVCELQETRECEAGEARGKRRETGAESARCATRKKSCDARRDESDARVPPRRARC